MTQAIEHLLELRKLFTITLVLQSSATTFSIQ